MCIFCRDPCTFAMCRHKRECTGVGKFIHHGNSQRWMANAKLKLPVVRFRFLWPLYELHNNIKWKKHISTAKTSSERIFSALNWIYPYTLAAGAIQRYKQAATETEMEPTILMVDETKWTTKKDGMCTCRLFSASSFSFLYLLFVCAPFLPFLRTFAIHIINRMPFILNVGNGDSMCALFSLSFVFWQFYSFFVGVFSRALHFLFNSKLL